MKREIGFKKEDGAEDRIMFLHEQGTNLAEEIARLKNLKLEAEAIIFDCYLDQFDIRIQARGRALLKGSKTKDPLDKAEVIRLLTLWEPSIGRTRLTVDERAKKEAGKMSDAEADALLKALQDRKKLAKK